MLACFPFVFVAAHLRELSAIVPGLVLVCSHCCLGSNLGLYEYRQHWAEKIPFVMGAHNEAIKHFLLTLTVEMGLCVHGAG